MAIEVELFDDLDAVARDAAGALDRERQPHVYDRLDWFRLTWDDIVPGARLAVVRAGEGRRRAWLFLTDAGGRRSEPLGSWYTLAFRPIFDGSPGEEERRALIAAIAQALAGRFDRLALAPVPEEDIATVQEGFVAGGWRAEASEATVGWRADVGGLTFDRYWDARPGELRSTVRRKASTPSLAYRLTSRFEEDLWADYERVYAASWKPAEGSPAFLRHLAELEGGAGALRMSGLYRNGDPIAAQLWLVENDVATIHKLAHVESAKAFSPGTLLSAAMFRYVIEEDRPATIDFGTGDDAYKADWMDRKAPLFRLELYRVGTIADRIGATREALAWLVRRPPLA